MFKIRCFTFVFLFAQSVLGQDKYVIPFSLTPYNNLSVKAILNKKDTVQLMFHTAANALTLTEETVNKLKSIRFTDSTNGIQSWGGSANARLSKNNSLQIAELNWNNVSIWENKNSGQGTDGKFGIDLFENKVIEIDFDRQLICVYNSMPVVGKEYVRLPLVFKNDEMFVEAELAIGAATYKNKFLLHSGYSGGLLLDDAFANENKLGEKLKIVGEKALKDSYGNIVKTKKAILPLLRIGNVELFDAPAGFFEGNIGRQTMSIMGGDILKRFNMIIDANRENIYLKENSLARSGYSAI